MTTELQDICQMRKSGDLGDSGGISRAAAADRVTEYMPTGGNEEEMRRFKSHDWFLNHSDVK